MTTTAEVRRTLGATQEAFARLLGVSFSTVNAWERGRSAPTRENAELLALLGEALKKRPVDEVKALLEGAGSRARLIVALDSLR